MDEITKSSLSYGVEAYMQLHTQLEQYRQTETVDTFEAMKEVERNIRVVERGLVHFIAGVVTGDTAVNTAAFVPPQTLKRLNFAGTSYLLSSSTHKCVKSYIFILLGRERPGNLSANPVHI